MNKISVFHAGITMFVLPILSYLTCFCLTRMLIHIHICKIVFFHIWDMKNKYQFFSCTWAEVNFKNSVAWCAVIICYVWLISVYEKQNHDVFTSVEFAKLISSICFSQAFVELVETKSKPYTFYENN